MSQCLRTDLQRTSDADDDTLCTLELVDVHDTLKSKLFEVQPVCLVEVGRHGFGIVIDHNRLFAHLPDGSRTSNGTPIELDR